MPSDKQALSAVSLFTGAGGVDVGFRRAGFHSVFANDIDKDACATYAKNHSGKVVRAPFMEVFPLLNQYTGADCVFGGPPCQGFSVAGKMKVDDPRNQLVWDFLSAVALVRPKVFVMENVPSLKSLDRFRGVYEGIYLRAQQAGYHVVDITLNAEDFGVAQRRERVFFFGSLEPIDENALRNYFLMMSLPKKTVRDVIIPMGKAGTPGNDGVCTAKIVPCKNPILRKSAFAGMLFNGAGRPLDPNRASPTITATTGGNRTPFIDEANLFDGTPSVIEAYHAHLMSGGKVKTLEEIGGALRRLTWQEGAALQTFSTDYQFEGKVSSVWRQIGNAIPCDMAYVIGSAARKIATSEFAFTVNQKAVC